MKSTCLIRLSILFCLGFVLVADARAVLPGETYSTLITFIPKEDTNPLVHFDLEGPGYLASNQSYISPTDFFQFVLVCQLNADNVTSTCKQLHVYPAWSRLALDGSVLIGGYIPNIELDNPYPGTGRIV